MEEALSTKGVAVLALYFPMVKTDGEMLMVKTAIYTKSTGDEPGTKKGIFSGTVADECEFMMYSFDVMCEGKNMCRLGDPLFHNKKNIMG